jgi:hypothetical protein
MEKVKFSITLGSDYQTVPPRARVTIADKKIFEGPVSADILIIDPAELDNDSDFQLRIELIDKIPEHTVLDEQGNIVKDSVLTIKKIIIEDIEIQSNLSLDQEKFYYEHSGGKHQLYDSLGVNGTAVINFSTPFYIWLLETI